MSDRLPVLNDMEDSNLESYGTALSPNPGQPRSISSVTEPQYEELMQGSVPCPSCNGSGRVPKELESQLVAIIPMNDARLKPRRTWFWVALAVGFCLLISSLCLFFLFPRGIDLELAQPVAFPSSVKYVDDHNIVIYLMVRVNVTNHNFYSIRVTNTTLNILSEKFWPSESSTVLGTGKSTGNINVPINGHSMLLTNTTVNIDKESKYSLWEQCVYVTWFTATIDYTATVTYMGHTEQSTLNDRLKVCCGKGANSTSCGSSHYED